MLQHAQENRGHGSAARRRRGGTPLGAAFVRTIASGGVIGIGVALGAILTSQDVAGWIVGLVVAAVSVVLSTALWSLRRP